MHSIAAVAAVGVGLALAVEDAEEFPLPLHPTAVRVKENKIARELLKPIVASRILRRPIATSKRLIEYRPTRPLDRQIRGPLPDASSASQIRW
jgi:hypothetical protein